MDLFHTRVDRTGCGSLKEHFKPEQVRREDLVSYWGAEFEFPTCPAFTEGVMRCARRGLYGFTLQDEVYNERVIWWMAHMRGWEIEPDWIVPAHGTIFALSTAIRTLVGEGENIVILTPGYNRYQQAADRNGRGTVRSTLKYTPDVNGDMRYSIDFEDLERKLAARSNKLLVLCNPNNPTGTVWDGETLRRISALSEKYRVPVFSDEIFAEVVLEGDRVIPYGEIAGPGSLSMTCTSLGKCMSLTGVNHANLLIPDPELRERYEKQKYADHYGSLDPMLYAGLMSAYTEDGAAFVKALRQVVRQNAVTIRRSLEECLPGVRLTMPQGTFVVWVDYRGLGLSDEELERFLHEEALFFGDRGDEYYGDRQFYRYSIAAPPECVERSMEYVKRAAIARGFIK